MLDLAKRGKTQTQLHAVNVIYEKHLVGDILEKVPGRYKDRVSRFTRIKTQLKKHSTKADMLNLCNSSNCT